MSAVLLLSCYGLSSRLLRKLLEADFVYDADVQGLTSTELSTASGLDTEECAEIIRLVSKPQLIQTRTVLQVVEDEDKYIVTFCKGLDDILGGGLSVGSVTEVIGPPGIGKTQLCLQVCTAAQLPTSIGGLNGEVIYIDTEGSFSSGRLKEITTHAIQHLKSVNALRNGDVNFTVESVLGHVHYFRCHSLFQVMGSIKQVSHLQKENQRIRLIIVDSMALPVQQDVLDYKVHRQLQNHIAQELVNLAITTDLAVLLISHLTDDRGYTAIEAAGVGVHEANDSLSKQQVMSELENTGPENLVVKSVETWSHYVDIKVKLNWENGARVARLCKAPYGCNIPARFQVTAAGIRDLIADDVPVTDGEIRNK